MSFPRSRSLLMLLALPIGMGSLYASSLTITSGASTTVSCTTFGGPGAAASVVVSNSTASSVTIQSISGLPAGVSVTSSLPVSVGAGQTSTVTFNYAAGCAGAGASNASGSTTTAKFMVGASAPGTADAALTSIAYSYTVNGTPLVITPSPVSVTCVYSGGSYTPNAASVKVSSTATGGTPFTVASSPSWLTVSAAGTATASGLSMTFTPSTCSGAVGSSMTGTVTLAAYPTTQTKTVTVTLQVVGPSPLTIATPASKTYVKNSGSYPSWTVSVKSTPSGLFFNIDPTSLPKWLTASVMNGTATTSGLSVTFQATSILDSLNAGSVSASVVFKVTGYADTVLPLNLVLNNPASSLSVVEGTVRNLTWIQGQPLPTAKITAVSSDAPISFTISTTGAIALPSKTSGVAYSFGTVLPVTFNVLQFAEAQPGNVLTGTETLQWGSNSTVITFNITVQTGSTAAVLTGASPTNLPTAAAGQTFTVTLYGTGFIPGSDPSSRTNVGIVSGGVIQSDSNVSANIVNSSTIVLTITVPSSDPLLPWTGNQTVTFGVCNPGGGTCSSPTGTTTLVIGAGPTISAVYTASKSTSTTTPAPFDILTIWGYNFCSSNGSGCSATQVLYGSPDPVTYTYPTSLSPDAGQRKLTVTFQTHGTSTVIGTAPLLFATNNQINLIVPGGLTVSTQYDIVVNFGSGAYGSATMLSSAPFPITIAQTDPGIFTLNQDGTGDAAVLKSNWTVVGAGNAASMTTSGSGTSDQVSIFATGLGSPTYSGGNCITQAQYEAAAGGLTSLDGVVIQAALLNPSGLKSLPPCFSTSSTPPVISVGGQNATLSYAGWVANSVAGLYQLDVTLPSASGTTFTDASGGAAHALTVPVQLPVKVTYGGANSPATGVTIWANPVLRVAVPSNPTGDVSGGWSSNNVVTASGGSGSFTFACSNCSTLTATDTATTRTFTAPTTKGVYVVSVTATDTSTPPISGTGTFSLTVTDPADTSTVTASATAVTPSTYGSANSAVTTISAGSGTAPYTYAMTPSISGIAIDANGVVSTTASAGAGTYHVDVTITDSTTPSAMTRDIYFDIPIALAVASSNGASLSGNANQTNSNLTTISATGASTVHYSLLKTNLGNGCTAAIGTSTGILSASGCPAGTYFATVIATDQAASSATFTPAATSINVAIVMN